MGSDNKNTKAMHSTRGARCTQRLRRQFASRTVAIAVSGALGTGPSLAWAAPVGEQVVAGQASISRAGASTLITQSSERAAINWQGFDIGAGESVRFAQPSASSIVLNRVLGQDPTRILGSLSANGQVFLINPNGVLFGKGAQVDVGGLVASTLGLGNANFMAGHYRFVKDGTAGEVRNAGAITANGGYVALLGPRVVNEGAIVAANGGVALGAGEQVTLSLNGGKLIGMNIERGALQALADNQGLIKADGGQVILSARAADQLVRSVVNNDGIVEAATLTNRNGEIFLAGDTLVNHGSISADGAAAQNGGTIRLAMEHDVTLGTGSRISAYGARGGDITIAARQGTLLADGRIEATGRDGNGGRVTLTGERVGLVGAAALDVSGTLGGGEALVGGGFQGKDAAVQNAYRTYFGADASISADATHNGHGGRVIVWSNDFTRAYGRISARGGEHGGDGGFVEVSGKKDLDFRAAVALDSRHGKGGTLLLDPLNIILNTTTQPAPPNNATGTPDIAFADAPAAGTTTVQIADVTGYAELYLQATNDITLASALTMGTGNSVRFEAGNNVNINSALTVSGAGAVTLRADADNSGAGTAALTAAIVARQGGVNISGASVTSSAAGTITTTATAGVAGGNVTIAGSSAAGTVTLAGAITANGGAGAAGQAGGNAGNVTVTGAAAVTTGAITASGGAGGTGAGFAGGNGGTIAVTSNGTLLTGALAGSGGNGGGTTAAGGNAGTITVSNNSALGGTLTTGTLTARTGAAVGAALSGLAGSVNVTNLASTLLQAGAINTSGQAGGAGGNVSLMSAGNVSETSTIQTGGGALNAGTVAAGRNAGNVTISGVNRSVTGAITASGGAGLGTNQAGGNAGTVSITGSGTLSTAAITASTGAATGTGAGGTAGSITLNGSTVTSAALTTTGGANGNGGAINVSSTSGATIINGAVTSSGGAANAGTAGRNAGAITINSAGNLTGTGLTLAASGSNASGATLNLAGGHGAVIDIDAAGTITVGNVTASGGNASTTNAAGGNAGSILITNNSAAAGAITTGTLSARTGAAQGTGAGGTAGAITLINNAAAQGIDTAAINASGQTSGEGGNVTLSAQGDVTVTGTIATSGAAPGTGSTAAGRRAGNVTITGVNRSVTGAIIASGGAGLGTNQAGGNAGTVSITGSGTLSTAAITASTGAATGAGAGGTAGSITLSGSATTAAALTTTGGANGNGGAITVSSTASATSLTGAVTASGGTANAGSTGRNAGTVSISGGTVNTLAITANGSNGNGAGFAGGNGAGVAVTGSSGNIAVGAISTVGGNGASGNAAGGNAGTITLDAGGAAPTITLAGNLTASGGNRAGSGAAGAGAQIRVMDAALLNAATVTANALGGSAGLGAGGAVRFDGAVDSTGGARILAANTNGVTTFGGAVGGVSALQSLATDAPGSTQINGGLVNTVGTQTYNDALTLGAATTLQTTNSAVTAANTVTATAGTLTLATGSGNVTMSNAANDFGTLQVNSAGNVTLTDANALTFATLNVSGNLTANATGALNLGQGSVGGNLVANSNGGAITQAGALTVAGATTLNAGANSITLSNAGNDFTGTVRASNSGANAITLADANALTLGASSAGGTFTARALGGNLTLAGAIAAGSAGGAGDTLVLAASANFLNAGAFALNPGAGRFLVWSTNPALDTRGGLAYNFKQYGATFGDTVLGSGNGFLYSVAPAITASLAGAANKVYDGTVLAPTGGLSVSGSGAIDGDTVTLSLAGAAYGDKHVGAGKAVTANGIAVAGASNGAATVYGYQMASTTAAANVGTITAAPLTVTAQADNRVYDATTASAVAPLISGATYDAVGSAAIQVYDNKHVGIGKTLTASGLVMNDGNGGNNYSVSYVPSVAGVITPAAIANVTGISADSKVYDATTVATLNTGAVAFTGAFAGDTLTVAAAGGVFADKNVGVGKTVNVNGITLGGADAGNYTLTSNTATTTANITPAAIANVTGILANNKVYDTTTAATLNTGAAAFTGAFGGDTLTVATASGAFTDKNAGIGKTVNVSGITLGGADAGNYTLASNTATTTANITPASIANVTGISANNRVYDATTAATLNTGAAAFTGAFAGDTLTVAAASGAFTDKNAGVGKTVNVSGITLGGADAGNYSLASNTATTAANITPAPLNVFYGGVNKVYDGTAAATVTTTDNRLGSDVFTINRAASFSDANAAIGKTVTVSAVSLAGADAGNYAVAATGSTSADIVPRALSIAADKKIAVVGNALPPFTATFTGFAPGDTPASLAGALTLTSPATAASPPGSYAIVPSGLSANNYTIAYVNGILNMVTGAGPIPVDVLAAIPVYDDTRAPRFISGPAALPASFAAVLMRDVNGESARGKSEAQDAAGSSTAQADTTPASEKPGVLSGAATLHVRIIDGGVRSPDRN